MQVESTLAVQALAPSVKELQAKHANDPERLQLETARLYKEANVNPLSGCLPTLATIPVFIGLYRCELMAIPAACSSEMSGLPIGTAVVCLDQVQRIGVAQSSNSGSTGRPPERGILFCPVVGWPSNHGTAAQWAGYVLAAPLRGWCTTSGMGHDGQVRCTACPPGDEPVCEHEHFAATKLG